MSHQQQIPSSTPQAAATLEANLRCLNTASAAAAHRILRTAAREDVEFIATGQGALSARLGGRLLASARRPLEEAEQFAGGVNAGAAGAVVVHGFGLGHHVAALARKLRGMGVVFVFEPDVALLRRVLETVDCREWLAGAHVVLLTDPDDRAQMNAAMTGYEGMISAGLTIVRHAPSTPRLGESSARLDANIAEVVRAVRTNVVTTLCQIGVTLDHMTQNLGLYARAPGIEDLRGAAAGRAGIVVAAGPSLARNMRELARPGVRERCVIIAVQTVLRPLLAAGIRPHFVTALDYAGISARFYEGLTKEDVRGVTLVVEPKAHPAIPAAYPGEVRCAAEPILDGLLGRELARPMGRIKPGATVAHLAYYLARHLGCDPVVLVGQDLGFTDGQYYAGGAAIHRVWASELNEFNSLEMMEWQRIVRMRRVLHKATDHLGRGMYTDEQMATYLVQFERDFAEDASRGLAVIDATEGGVLKQHATPEPLAAVLDRVMKGPRVELPPTPAGASRRAAVIDRVREVRRGVWRVGEICATTRELLTQMRTHHGDQPRVNALIEKAQKLGREVKEIEPAHGLVQHLNQTGMLRRFKADRAIELDADLPALERQKRQIERDIENVTWLGDSAREFGRLLDRAVLTLEGRPLPEQTALGEEAASAGGAPRRVIAVIAASTRVGGLGTPRELSRPFAGQSLLAATVRRVLACREIDGVAILTHELSAVAGLLGPLAGDQRVRIVPRAADPLEARRSAVRGARLWSRSSWRGGIAGLTVYDEAYAPRATIEALELLEADAAVIVGADWALLDPSLVDEMVRRYRAGAGKEGGGDRLLFVHAAPGLGAALLDRSVAAELAASARGLGPHASIGAMLGYLPMAPQVDPIAKPACIVAPPAARDLLCRCIPDSPERAALLSRALRAAGDSTDGESLARSLAPLLPAAPANPDIVELELRAPALAGERAAWYDAQRRLAVMPSAVALSILEQLSRDRTDLALTLGGPGEPMLHQDAGEIIASARELGIAGVHARTGLGAPAELDALLAEACDVVSVDLLTTDASAYARLTGRDHFDDVLARTRGLLARRGGGEEGLVSRWVVPRMTRCDAEYERLEQFVDTWLIEAGACALDPLPHALAGQRIGPLPVPEAESGRPARSVLRVRCDGIVSDGSGRVLGDAARQTLEEICTAAGQLLERKAS